MPALAAELFEPSEGQGKVLPAGAAFAGAPFDVDPACRFEAGQQRVERAALEGAEAGCFECGDDGVAVRGAVLQCLQRAQAQGGAIWSIWSLLGTFSKEVEYRIFRRKIR